MTPQEIRIACLTIVTNGGVRDALRLINDAKVLEEWVLAAEDKGDAPKAKTK